LNLKFIINDKRVTNIINSASFSVKLPRRVFGCKNYEIQEDQVSGFIPINESDDIFYWLFRSRNLPESAPLVIWLTGGPGCASELAVFYENGPFTINDDLTLKKNPYSWNN
jgi:cathepsin A (carboxypeptidase C)